MTQIITGDCRQALSKMRDCSVQCCVTSPPYFQLRDYGLVANRLGRHAVLIELNPAYVAIAKKRLADDA